MERTPYDQTEYERAVQQERAAIDETVGQGEIINEAAAQARCERVCDAHARRIDSGLCTPEDEQYMKRVHDRHLAAAHVLMQRQVAQASARAAEHIARTQAPGLVSSPSRALEHRQTNLPTD